MSTFPFKVGRESRSAATPPTHIVELRLGIAPQLNDVYLLEPPFADFIFISREHFLIDYDGQSLTLVDRGSVCGTIVQGKQIGGNRSGGRTVLQDGDEIIVGTTASPYRFRFDVVATP